MPAPTPITVLYEDQRGPTRGFGLHELVKASVHDRVGGDRYHVELALRDCRPMKGVSKLLAACREDIADIAADGRAVIAVFDDDRIRQELKLPPSAPDARVEQLIRKGSSAPAAFTIVLLKRNLETVLEAIRHCAPEFDEARVALAISKKDLLARDTVLAAIARVAMRAVRDCVVGRVPSLARLVVLLCELVPPTR